MDQWIAWACNFFLDRPIQYLLWAILLHPKFLGPISQLWRLCITMVIYRLPRTAAPVFPCHWGLGHCSSEGALMWVWCSFWWLFWWLCAARNSGDIMIILWLSWLSWGSFKCKKNSRHPLNLLISPYSNEKWNIVKLSKSSHQEGFVFLFGDDWDDYSMSSLRQEAPEGPKSGESPVPTPSMEDRVSRNVEHPKKYPYTIYPLVN